MMKVVWGVFLGVNLWLNKVLSGLFMSKDFVGTGSHCKLQIEPHAYQPINCSQFSQLQGTYQMRLVYMTVTCHVKQPSSYFPSGGTFIVFWV